MKISVKTLMLTLLISFSVVFGVAAFAQDPPPPPGGGHGGGGTQPPGGGAPIGEGLLILVALGAAYGSKKWYVNTRQNHQNPHIYFSYDRNSQEVFDYYKLRN